jgi:hypothetical protein
MELVRSSHTWAIPSGQDPKDWGIKERRIKSNYYAFGSSNWAIPFTEIGKG